MAFAADTWLTSGASAVVVLVVAAVVGGVSVLASDVDTGRAVRSGVGRRRRPPRVRDVVDPLAVGVHPCEEMGGDRTAKFVRRDVDEVVHAALRRRGFVLLVGESTAGKTRAAYEAMRAVLADHYLLRPGADEPIRLLVPAVDRYRRCVVWLDDLERYLGLGGFDSEVLDQLLASAPDVVVLATMRAQEHARYDRWRELSVDDTRLEIWRRGRQLLERAHQIPVDRRWSPQEVRRARECGDPRLAHAVERAANRGIAEYLTAGPELVVSVRNAWAPGAHPRAAAMVTAAVDCRRAGHHRPIPQALLEALQEPYLAARGGPALRPEPLQAGLEFATTPVYATASALLPLGDDSYLAHDYLIDALPFERIPDETWHTLLSRVTPAEAFDIGMAALNTHRFDHALYGFHRATEAVIPRAWSMLGMTLSAVGRQQEAAEHLRRALADDAPRLGQDHPDVVDARHALGIATGWSRRDEGAAILSALLKQATSTLGPQNRRVLAIRRSMIQVQARWGITQGALADLTNLLDDAVAALGPDDPDTLAIRLNLAYTTGRGGAAAAARDAFADLLPIVERNLGTDHLETLRCRHELARWTGDCGNYEAAITLFSQLYADRLRLFGPDHRDTLTARHNIARNTGEGGDPPAAVTRYAELVSDSTRALGAEHRDTLEARRQLARWTGQAGDHAGACAQLRALAADDVRVLGEDDLDTLETRYELARFTARGGAVKPAIDALTTLIPDQVAALGSDHTAVLDSRNELAHLQATTGAVTQALADLKQVLTERQRVHGHDHPATLHTRYQMAYWTGRSGDILAAQQALRALQKDCHRILSPGTALRRLVDAATSPATGNS